MSCKKITVAFAALFLCLSVPAAAAELVSSMEMDFNAIAAIDGIRVVAATDVPGKSYTEDYGPSQVLEIIRGNQAPISVGRLMTSCSCLRATLEKRDFGQGERALIEVRNVKPTQPNGAEYGIFVRLTEPYKATLQYELFAKSDRNLPGGTPAATHSHTVAAPVQAVPAPAPAPVQAPGFKFEDIVPYKTKAGEK